MRNGRPRNVPRHLRRRPLVDFSELDVAGWPPAEWAGVIRSMRLLVTRMPVATGENPQVRQESLRLASQLRGLP
jgi:hypothetical protein